MKTLWRALVVGGLLAVASTPALATTTVINGTTTGRPTFNRPVAGRPPNFLSGVGTAVNYDVTEFRVSVSGNYTFNLSTLYDNYLGVHQTAFNPATPLVNALAYDDDSGPGVNALIADLPLLAGVSYFAVASSFSNGDAGAYTLTIDGPGSALLGAGGVPEPATWAMMILGFGVVGGAMRRRRTTVRVAYA
jgi:hypothetical protein